MSTYIHIHIYIYIYVVPYGFKLEADIINVTETVEVNIASFTRGSKASNPLNRAWTHSMCFAPHTSHDKASRVHKAVQLRAFAYVFTIVYHPIYYCDFAVLNVFANQWFHIVLKTADGNLHRVNGTRIFRVSENLSLENRNNFRFGLNLWSEIRKIAFCAPELVEKVVKDVSSKV